MTVPPVARLAARRDHLVVCGDDALPDLRLAARDRRYVIATRAGLSRVLAGSKAPRE